ncbi:MAG: hypothetical protein C5B49_14895 [Bdellovibrio sp.]|nr:MAG: hypothetical protein C5B49_14895 [Bdellovibrio sp.]
MSERIEGLSKGQKTQEQIIRAAIKQFSRQGYEEVSLQVIADACGISRTAPLYHFGSKLGLFEKMVEYVQKKKMEVLLSPENIKISDNAFQRLNKFAKAYISWNFIYSSEAEVFLQLYYFSAHNNNFATLYKNLIENERKIIEEILLAGQRESIFHFKEPSQQLANILYSQITGLSIFFLAGRFQAFDRNEFDAAFSATLAKMTGYQSRAQI